MKQPLSEKENLLTRLTDIYEQLEELESVLEASFSDHRISLNREEQEKLTVPVQGLSNLGKKIANGIPFSSIEIPDSNPGQGSKSLQLELGF
jgi:hypothetical protein